MTSEHCCDARLRHGDAELLELPDDPEVAPARVPDQRAVPAEDRLRRDEERYPALSGYESGQEADDGTVGPAEAGTGGPGGEARPAGGAGQGSRRPWRSHPCDGREVFQGLA